jgi:hypothetical protein
MPSFFIFSNQPPPPYFAVQINVGFVVHSQNILAVVQMDLQAIHPMNYI